MRLHGLIYKKPVIEWCPRDHARAGAFWRNFEYETPDVVKVIKSTAISETGDDVAVVRVIYS